MSNTYAELAEFKARINVTSATNDNKHQAMLDAAAVLVDTLTRGYRPGYEAFSASASETRYYDDNRLTKGMVPIDDCLTVTAVTQGGSAVTSANYQLSPYNPGNGPYTRLEFSGLYAYESSLAGSLTTWYGHPYADRGAKQIAITGTWGYCTAINRPAAIKEATLVQATWQYEMGNLSSGDLVNIVAGGGLGGLKIHPLVLVLLAPFKRVEGTFV